MRRFFYTFFTVVFVLFMSVYAEANNLKIANVQVTDHNISANPKYNNIQFDISWDHSWKINTGALNWDAAWVFAKWKLTSVTDWHHCTLSTNNVEHSAPSGSMITASFTKDNTGRGVFISRSTVGGGSNNWTGVKLKWNYVSDGVADNALVDVKVFAVEMVYVLDGSFWLGDGTSNYTFQQTGSNVPVQITTSPVVVKCAANGGNDSVITGSGILVDGAVLIKLGLLL